MTSSLPQMDSLIYVRLTMAAAIRYVTTSVEEKRNVLVGLDINLPTIKRLVLVRDDNLFCR